MSSGIYKISFGNLFYIGKSADMEKRWLQHSKALKNNTHINKIQDAYNKFGDPKYSIVFECHPDHIDILEVYFINLLWDDKNILNTTRPRDLLDSEKVNIEQHPWNLSIFEILNRQPPVKVSRIRKLFSRILNFPI